jgi:XRE family transcriptional regulator, regulator of sulfur utilization
MGDQISLKIGKRVRELRMERGLSQEELAEVSGVHRTYVGAIERGEKNITIKMALKLCKALDINLEKFVEKLGD